MEMILTGEVNFVCGIKLYKNFDVLTDECTFHTYGLVNRHSIHYYSDLNPHENKVMKIRMLLH